MHEAKRSSRGFWLACVAFAVSVAVPPALILAIVWSEGGSASACLVRGQTPSSEVLGGEAPEQAARYLTTHAVHPLAGFLQCEYVKDGRTVWAERIEAAPMELFVVTGALAGASLALAVVLRPRGAPQSGEKPRPGVA